MLILEHAPEAVDQLLSPQPLSPMEEIEDAFAIFVQAQGRKDASIVSDQLKRILKCLDALKYTKRDITFALSVEALTVDRWEDGNSKGMKPDTYAEFVGFITDIIKGKSRRTVDISDTGFITWRYLMQEQAAAKRIWYIASSKFLADRSLAFKEAVRSLFLKPESHAIVTRLVYLYPKGSETESSLKEWHETLIGMRDQGTKLRGSIIGIADDGTDSWGIYLPGLRATLLEKASNSDVVQVEGYIRIKLKDNTKSKLLAALDPLEPFPHTPWLNVDREPAERWYNYCEKKQYVKEVDRKIREQKQPFDVHYL